MNVVPIRKGNVTFATEPLPFAHLVPTPNCFATWLPFHFVIGRMRARRTQLINQRIRRIIRLRPAAAPGLLLMATRCSPLMAL
jgi:hypothetical protein